MSEIEVPQTNAILAEHQEWLTAMRTSQTTRVSIQQGAQAVEIADAVIKSIDAHNWSANASETHSSETMPHVPPTLRPFPLTGQDEEHRKAA